MPKKHLKRITFQQVLERTFYHFFDKEGDLSPDRHAYSVMTTWVLNNWEQYEDELLDREARALIFKMVKWGRWDHFQEASETIYKNAKIIGNNLSLEDENQKLLEQLYWTDRRKGEDYVERTK